MQNRFSFKDGVLLVLLIIVGVLVVVGMYGNVRVFEKGQAVESKLSELEGSMSMRGAAPAASADVEELRAELNSIRDAIASRPINVYVTGAAATDASAAPSQPIVTMAPTESTPEVQSPAKETTASRSESWARPGYEIEWQEPWTFGSNPEDIPGFQKGGEFTI